ncbi:hypothetical protein [Cellulomonas sp. SG140]|nr:hypothetical protein [Cellulomonas sp. SG140]
MDIEQYLADLKADEEAMNTMADRIAATLAEIDKIVKKEQSNR